MLSAIPFELSIHIAEMIPKIIHYCWFGPNPKTEEFQGYLETWKKLLPDYEIREWNESNFDASKYLYSREASRLKSYAHVSDVCRLYALYNYGGIYLDTDVELLQSFNPFLKYESFLGTEVWMVGTGVIGSEAGAKWIELFLDYYSRTHFINIFGHAVRTPNSDILTKKLLPSIPARYWPAIFPRDYFSAKNWDDGTITKSVNTVSIHHYSASWRHKKTFREKIVMLFKGFGVRFLGKK